MIEKQAWVEIELVLFATRTTQHLTYSVFYGLWNYVQQLHDQKLVSRDVYWSMKHKIWDYVWQQNDHPISLKPMPDEEAGRLLRIEICKKEQAKCE